MNATTRVSKEDKLKDVALISLQDRIAGVLVGRERPPKTAEVLRSVEGEGITSRLVRFALSENDRFTFVDRRWALVSRLEDTQRPFERVVEKIIKLYGRPITIQQLAHELAAIYDRPAEHYESVLPRLIINKEKYFEVGGGYGLYDWLLHATVDSMEDVVFDNFLSEDEVEHFRPSAEGLNWEKNPTDAVVKMLDKAGEPVPIRIAALFAWSQLESDYDAVEFYTNAMADDRVLLLSNQKLVGEKITSKIAKSLADLSEAVEAMPLEFPEEAEAGPVEITEGDLEESIKMVLAEEGTVSAAEMLDEVLEVSEGEGEYEPALEKLMESLRADERIVWVGDIRFRPIDTIPDYVNEVPDSLIIPTHTPYETPEGDVYDQELEDEGLEGSLKTEIFNPLVEDYGDEDLAMSMVQPMDKSQRCVLKYQHKEAGSFPLCQINPEFFGAEPEIIQIILVDEGIRREAWVNNRTRLIYDMKDWYQGEWPVSGGVFYLEKTEKPGEFRFVRNDEHDSMVHVPNNRLFELLELKNEADTNEMPVFDIVTRIMDQHKKGVGFVTLFTEVNLVRRVTRRLVASILSSYHAFYQRPKSSEWQYDEKKRSQGFNKAKRKYIKK